MKVATAAEMRDLDLKTIDQTGVPGVVLMENAGLRVVELIEAKFASLCGLKVVILCGKGNNGGDGFVIARHLANAGARPQIFLTASAEETEGDAAIHRGASEGCALPATDLRDSDGMEALRSALERCDLVVEALLGTGITGEVRGIARAAIEQLQGCPAPVVAVDVPAGVDSDSGGLCGIAVQATWTVTFALPKRGLLLYPGASRCGELWLGDLGMKAEILSDPVRGCHLITQEVVREWLPSREPEAHKGSCGRVGICAGSSRYAGAAILASRAATRSGAGLVTVLLPKGINPPVKAASVEATTWPVSETDEETIAATALEEAKPLFQRIDAVAIGPGLSRNPETLGFVRETLQQVECPSVIDADAIFAFARQPESLKRCKAPRVLTPHPGEMAELLGVSTAEVQADRIAVAVSAAAATGSVVVLKGARSIVATPEGETFINPTGNPGMASGGTGDVLTGVIVALLGQGLSPCRAAVVGVYLHGSAGDLVVQRTGEAGLVAGDLVESISRAWMNVVSGESGEWINPRLRRLI